MDSQPSAPPVVAVVVTCDPGPWLEDCLSALADQDYPNLSVLVIDAASTVDPTARVAGVMPTAYVRRVAERRGFAAAANEVLGVVEGASHFLFCHDDIVVARDAVLQLVEEAFRSNAGVVTPKLVDWESPDRLLAVGASADKGGVLVPFVERGELDQEQHDAVRDVFVAPAGCLLVRADLFATLGGFDPAMTLAGEELDLSWRAQIAGARVVVAPGAVVGHLEVTATGRRALDGSLPAPVAGDADEAVSAVVVALAGATGKRRRGLRARRAPAATTGEVDARAELGLQREVARLRAVLKNYSFVHLLRVVPQLIAVSAMEVVLALVGRRPKDARAGLAWRANVGNWRDIVAARKGVRAHRAVPDHEVRQLQTRGNERLRALARVAVGRSNAQDEARHLPTGDELAASWRHGLRLTLAVWAGVIVIVVFGSRYLLSGALPLYGEFVPFVSPSTLLQHALSGWRVTGLGSPSPAPTTFALLAAAGALLLGHVAFLQRLLVVGMLPAGAIGMWRLGRPFEHPRAGLVMAVLYLANPLPYNAFARGHWSGMIAYGAAPWIIVLIARASGLAPFDRLIGRARATTVGTRLVAFGLLLALVGAFVPALVPLAIGTGAMLVVGSLLAGGTRAALRATALTVGAAGVAIVLLFPWAIGFLPPGGEWATFVGPAPGLGHAPSLAQLLRFQTGPVGASPLGWALLAAALLPLVVGHDWRFAWATRLWTVALGAWALAWLGGRGWLPVPLPPAEVVLAPAAVALAACAGLGLAAFEIDLRGYHFGWRQLVSAIAAAGAGLVLLPAIAATGNGRWQAPSQGFDQTLSWLPDKRVDGDFRVLWLGDPTVMPIASWRLHPGLAFATSLNGLPDVSTSWPGTSRGATRLLGQGVDLAQHDQTTQLGHLLAPLAVRYVIVVQSGAPTSAAVTRPAPPALLGGLAAQLDLRRVDSDPSVVIYENAAWAPARALLPAAAVSASESDDPASVRNADLSNAPPVLARQTGPTSFSGPLSPGTVLWSAATSDRWQLRVGDVSAPRVSAFGSVNTFDVTTAGPATLSYGTPLVRTLSTVVQWLLWPLAVVWLWRRRHRDWPTDDGEASANADSESALGSVPVEVGA